MPSSKSAQSIKFNQYLLSFYAVSDAATQSYTSEGPTVVPDEGERG